MKALRSFKKRLFRFCLSNTYTTASPDALSDFRDFHAAMEAGRIPYFHHLELIVHPGHEDYREETELLKSDSQKRLPPTVCLGAIIRLRRRGIARSNSEHGPLRVQPVVIASRIGSFEVFSRCAAGVFAEQSGYRSVGIKNHK